MSALELKPNKEEKLEKLPEDYDTPFSPPSDVPALIPADDPALDDYIDPQEFYDEGLSGAAEATRYEGDDNKERNYLERIG